MIVSLPGRAVGDLRTLRKGCQGIDDHCVARLDGRTAHVRRHEYMGVKSRLFINPFDEQAGLDTYLGTPSRHTAQFVVISCTSGLPAK
jgi:hypothetical protein